MKNLYREAIILSVLLLLVNSLDNTTLSNYKTIRLVNLEGVFEPDFEQKILKGDLAYTFIAQEDGSEIILDTRNLNITSIKCEDNDLEYKFDEENESYGIPLVITKEYKKDDAFKINIKYTTTEEGNSAQFLNKKQTVGGEHDYFFTMSEMIVGRELLPSQDTPAVKFPFYLGIKVPKDLRGMISGLFVKVEEEGDTKTFYYKQEIPVPNYLIALAAGNIVERNITDNISVYSEPEFIQKVYDELEDLPKILNHAISYMGPYDWGKYNVLVLPNSFPFSGMENPCLSFCSPCLINGDKSLVDIVAHELIHSWSGNLVTNENWRDFWLNEGITTFLQRKIVGLWKNSSDYSKMDAILGTYYIEEYLDYFGENSTYTTLRPEMDGVNPDDVYSDIPYEKGFNLVYYIESLIGEETMKDFFQSYFDHFKYTSLDFYDFKKYFIDFCSNHSIPEETLNKIDWNAWIFTPGKCPVENDFFTNKYKTEMDKAYDKFIKEELDEELITLFNNLIHSAKTVFMNQLEQREEFLTEKQHQFLANQLKLYEGQNFLISTNYYRLILAKAEKIYENEEKGLINYLSNNGASDYMVGLYELYYKRDEVKAVETLDSLRDFYHPLMINQAEEEIKKAQESFPILTLDFKNKDQCLKENGRIELKTEDFKFTEKIEITKGIYIQSDKVSAELNCYIDSKEKYCLVKQNKDFDGEFTLKIPERIQNNNYAIKAYNSTLKIKKCETPTNEESSFPKWLIVVIVIASLLIIVVLVFCIYRTIKRNKNSNIDTDNKEGTDTQLIDGL